VALDHGRQDASAAPASRVATRQRGRHVLRLELDRGSDPISGRLITADGAAEDFAGWLALAGAIERATQSEART
jgi:hypothetical protein